MKLLEWTLAPLAMLALPLALLNLLGGIIGGIWLMVLGEWSAIFLGVAVLAFGAFAAALLLAPGMVVAGLGAASFERGNAVIGWCLMILAAPWTYLVVLAWQTAIFDWYVDHSTSDNAIPLWLWSFGAATGVWSFMASKETEDSMAPVTAFCAQISFLVISGCVLLADWPLRDAAIAGALPFLLPIGLSVAMVLNPPRRSFR